MSRILVTGAAGFIGFYLAQKLLHLGHDVLALITLMIITMSASKQSRLDILKQQTKFQFEKIALENKADLDKAFTDFKPDCVINLAAQAGVRYSLENPSAYINSNLVGFGNILESCRHHKIAHLIFASSSSVYGANETTPFKTSDNVDHPLSLMPPRKGQ